jgi:hypothetical protein
VAPGTVERYVRIRATIKTECEAQFEPAGTLSHPASRRRMHPASVLSDLHAAILRRTMQKSTVVNVELG